MPQLYRSPNVLIDNHEWHVCVERNPRSGRVITIYRFRPAASDQPVAWRPLTSWPGRLPKGLRKFFAFADRSIEIAREGAARSERRAA